MAKDVTFQSAGYKNSIVRWTRITDACAGQDVVKSGGDKYLPRPNAEDVSYENRVRYERYLDRAVYYNVVGRAVNVLTGVAFSRDPELIVNPSIEYVEDDIDGSGVSIHQQAQMTTMQVIKLGRHALLVDYPKTSGATSAAEMRAGSVRAVTIAIPAQKIINWRTTKVGANHKLSLVVISESSDEVTEDGFGVDSIKQYRVLRLEENIYTQEVWRKNKEGQWVIHEPPFALRDGSGRTWNEIPLVFVGSINNDPEIDPPPMYDMAELNLAHYRNSADYEDSAFFCGQAQPWLSGLSEEWRTWIEERGLYVGSRSPILLPVGGQFGIEQAEPNTMVREAMTQKEEQMVALGARLIQPGGVAKTATESQGEQDNNQSILSTIANNVSNGYTQALQWMARFMNASDEVYYTLSQEFKDRSIDPQLITALSTIYNTGTYPKADLWNVMKRINLIDPDKSDEEIREELDSEIIGLSLDDSPSIS